MPSLHLIHWYEGTPSALKKAMNCDVDPMLLNKKFRLTNKTVVERVQLDTIEDFVFERCGEMSYRIFRMVKILKYFFNFFLLFLHRLFSRFVFDFLFFWQQYPFLTHYIFSLFFS